MTEINWNPDARTLRWFAGLQVLFFCLLLWVWRDRFPVSVGAAIISLSVVLGITGLIRPAAVRWCYVGWMAAVFPLGWLVSHLLLAVVYYLVLTPIALAVRGTRGRMLDLEFDPEAASYWTPRRRDRDVSDYFRQY